MTKVKNSENPYSTAFYTTHSDGSLKSAKEFLGYFFGLYQPNSVVDLGCGIGTWLTVACELGVRDLVGIDGLWIDEEKLNPEIVNYSLQDLEHPISIDRIFDLALSLEVAEHLTPQRAESFIQNICRASDLIIFGAAIPGQGGTNHINEQKQSYWISLFENHGYHCLDLFRPVFWNSPHVEWWYAQNTFLFVKPEHPHFKRFQQHSQTLSPILDIYHPRLFSSRFRTLEKQRQPNPLDSSNPSISLTVGQYGYILEAEGQPPLYLQDDKGNMTPERFSWIDPFITLRKLELGFELLGCHQNGKLAKWFFNSSGVLQKYEDLTEKSLKEVSDEFQLEETTLRQLLSTIDTENR